MVVLPSTLQTIPAFAFNGCDGLQSIYIPDSIKSLGSAAVSTNSLISVKCNFSGTDYTLVDGKLTINNMRVDTTTEDTTYTEWYNDNVNQLITSVEFTSTASTCTEIIASAFDCSNIKQITIPSTVQKIGDNAFGGCVFESVTCNIQGTDYSLVNGRLTINNMRLDTTEGADSSYPEWYNDKIMPLITSYILPQGCTEIVKHSFTGASLDEIIIPNTIKTIGEYAFAFIDELLNSIIIPESVETIGDSAFLFTEFKNVIFESLSYANQITAQSSGGYILGTGLAKINVKVKCNSLDEVTSAYLKGSNFTSMYKDGYAIFTR